MPFDVGAIKYVFNNGKLFNENNFCYSQSLTADLLDEVLKADAHEVYSAAKIRHYKDIRVYSINLQTIIKLYNKQAFLRNSLIKKSTSKSILHVFLKIITLSFKGLTARIVDIDQANTRIKALKANYLVLRKKLQFIERKKIDLNHPRRMARFQIEEWNKRRPPSNYNQLRDRALGLKKIYAPTHYLFLHGQSQQISVLTTLNKFFIKRFCPVFAKQKSHQGFRIPGTVKSSRNVAEFHSANETIDDHVIRDQLLSVDGDFYNTTSPQGSAHYFTTSNSNVIDSYRFREIVNSIVKKYIDNKDLVHKFTDRVCTIASWKQRAATLGALYLIAIPREFVEDKSKNFVYRSHPRGRYCYCHAMDSHESMTNGTMAECRFGFNRQYRILTSRLTEEPDVKVHRLTTIPKNTRVAYRELIHRTGLEIALCQNLEKVIRNPSKELWDQIVKDVVELSERYQKAQRLSFAIDIRPLFLPLLKAALPHIGDHLGADQKAVLAACVKEQ